MLIDKTIRIVRRISVQMLLTSILLLYPSTAIFAKTLPANWPWRGILITSADNIDAGDIKYLADIKVNAIEIQLTTRFVAKKNKLNADDALMRDMKWADTILDECKKYGIIGIISISQIPIDPESGITQDSPEFWDNPEKRNIAANIASLLAAHYKSRGRELGAYKFFAEPAVRRGKNLEFPEFWPNLMNEIIAAVRKQDSSRYIILTPGLGGMAKGYEGFKPLNDSRIIYGMHMYTPHGYTHQGIQGNPSGIKYPGRVSIRYWDKQALESSMDALIKFQRQHDVLVWIGEFSAIRWAEGSEKYIKDLIDIFDKYGWGWAYFCYKSYHGWNPDYDNIYSTDKPEDWKSHYVGRDTPRWKLLRAAFSKNKARETGQ